MQQLWFINTPLAQNVSGFIMPIFRGASFYLTAYGFQHLICWLIFMFCWTCILVYSYTMTNLMHTCFNLLQYVHYNTLHVSSITCSSSGDWIVLMLYLVSFAQSAAVQWTGWKSSLICSSSGGWVVLMQHLVSFGQSAAIRCTGWKSSLSTYAPDGRWLGKWYQMLHQYSSASWWWAYNARNM